MQIVSFAERTRNQMDVVVSLRSKYLGSVDIALITQVPSDTQWLYLLGSHLWVLYISYLLGSKLWFK